MLKLLSCVVTALAAVAVPHMLAAQEAKSPDRSQREMRGGPRNIEAMFQRLDANHDGAITPDEIPAGMPEGLRSLLQETAKNHDGRVTLDAFREAVEKFRPDRGPGSPGAVAGERGFRGGFAAGEAGRDGAFGGNFGPGPGFAFGGGRGWNRDGGPAAPGPGFGRGESFAYGFMGGSAGPAGGFAFRGERGWNAESGSIPPWAQRGPDFAAGPPWRMHGGPLPPWQGQRFGFGLGRPWGPAGGWYAHANQFRGPSFGWWQQPGYRHGGYGGQFRDGYAGHFHRGYREQFQRGYAGPFARDFAHGWKSAHAGKYAHAGMHMKKGAAEAGGVEAKLADLQKEEARLTQIEESIKTKLVALEKRHEEIQQALLKAVSQAKPAEEKKPAEKKLD